jgi:hypothetical protein
MNLSLFNRPETGIVNALERNGQLKAQPNRETETAGKLRRH